MKPYYDQGGITIYHGRCEDVLPALEPGAATMLLTDPPYGEVSRVSGGLRNLNKGKADEVTVALADWLPGALRVITGSAYVWCGTEQVSDIRRLMTLDKMTTRLCIWEKTNPSPMNGQYLWLSSVESCVFGRREKATFREFCASPVFRGPVATTGEHETPKPEWLMRRLLQASSNPGDVVLDCFAGGGATVRAAKDLQRGCIAVEADESACEAIARRLSQEVLPLELVPV